jgi:hypothetical protein
MALQIIERLIQQNPVCRKAKLEVGMASGGLFDNPHKSPPYKGLPTGKTDLANAQARENSDKARKFLYP